MTKIRCCLCNRRTDKTTDRKNIGTPSTWQSIQLHVIKIGLEITDFSKEDFVCLKCYATVSHHRMNDRGPNKKNRIRNPVIFETIINKTVLRGFTRPQISESDTSAIFESTTDDLQHSINHLAISSVTDKVHSSIADNSHESRSDESSTIIFENAGKFAIVFIEAFYSNLFISRTHCC